LKSPSTSPAFSSLKYNTS